MFVGAAGNQAGAATDLTINKPAGVQVGDVLLSFTFSNTFTVPTPLLSGWTNIRTDALSDGTTADCTMRTQYRIADGTEGASFTFSKGGQSAGWCGSILAYRSMQPSPIDVSNDTATGNVASGTGIVAPSVVANFIGDALVCAFGINLASPAFALDASLAQRDSEAGSGASSSCIVGDVLLSAVGATGTKTTTWTGINRTVIGVSVALAAAPAPLAYQNRGAP